VVGQNFLAVLVRKTTFSGSLVFVVCWLLLVGFFVAVGPRVKPGALASVVLLKNQPDAKFLRIPEKFQK
jgi:hypothetical protein